jgi:GNAT superfamily N-acetyltransferase
VSGIEIVTTSDRTDLEDQLLPALGSGWPEFIFHDPISKKYIERVQKYFARFDVLLLEDGQVVAGGWGVPLAWDGTVDGLPGGKDGGYDGAMAVSVDGYEAGTTPDTLSVMAAAVHPERRGSGLAGQVLTALRERATAAGLDRVIAPVRPTLKARYPLTPMDRFATWTRPDGLHLDPWIRTHQRLGATILASCERSMTMPGTVADWESWSGLTLPESGQYVIPDALDLLHVDRETDHATYTEPNLWIRHR